MQAPVTFFLIGITCLVSWMAFNNRKLMDRLILWPPAIDQHRQYDRLVTYGFIHGDFMHQVDGWFHDEQTRKYTIIACGKNDCPALAELAATTVARTMVSSMVTTTAPEAWRAIWAAIRLCGRPLPENIGSFWPRTMGFMPSIVEIPV